MMEQGQLIADDAVVARRPRILAASFAVLAALLLAILVVLALQANHKRDAALARKQHSYEVMILTAEVDGSMARAEAALGRYVIGKDPRSGTAYYEQWRRAGRQLDALARLVRDSPDQARRATMLRALYAERERELAPAGVLIFYKRQWNALSLFARAGKSPVLPSISLLLREIASSERTLADQRADTAAWRVWQSNLLAQLLSLVGVLLVGSAVAAGWLALIAIAAGQRARAEAQAEIDRTGALERAVAERTVALSEANARLREEAAERAGIEARLRQAHKMDAVGQLTGGIAHDFNNMLAVVIGGLELARRRVEDQAAEAGRHIDNAMAGAERAAGLTRRLLSFARAEPLLPVATDPGALARGMSDLIDRTIGERIAVEVECPAGLWAVWCDPLQLENALLNLCVNARDAMAGVGVLRIALANVALAAGEAGEAAAGDYVRLAVSDDGAGMTVETLERVFEPFFTTKPIGKGTGLGLSQIFGFTRQSGGEVVVESAEGVGTTVSLYLPRHVGAALPAPAAADTALPQPAIEGVVLVVEDDARVRGATGDALAELGYRPVLVGSAEEAIASLTRRDDVALLLTDVVMPDMTGPELVEAVRATRPDLPVLFVTGYVGEAAEADRFAGRAVLRKPYTIRALAGAVAAALG